MARPSRIWRAVFIANSPGVAVLLLGLSTFEFFGMAPSKMAKMMDAMPVMTNCGITMKTLCIPWSRNLRCRSQPA